MKSDLRGLISVCLLLWSGSAWAQTSSPEPFPTPPPVEITPEMFPTVTPLPPKAPVATPQPVVTPQATAQPSISPTPRPTTVPTPSPVVPGQTKLVFNFPALTEGQRARVQLQLQGPAAYPVKGRLRFGDGTYDLSQTQQRTVPFEIKGPGPTEVPVVFRTPGRKTIQIEADVPGIATRNVLGQVAPYVTTVFPRATGGALSTDPKRWHVWVNLHHSLSEAAPQRQYYLVTHDGVLVQKLLTSSATPDKITPLGQFRLGPKAASPTSTLYDSVMPFWTTILVPGFSYEYGNHGLVGEGYLYNLGVPASHGCLRLSNKWVQQGGQWVNIGAAKWVFSHVPVGTPIHIFKRPAQPFAYENYRNWLSKAG